MEYPKIFGHPRAGAAQQRFVPAPGRTRLPASASTLSKFWTCPKTGRVSNIWTPPVIVGFSHLVPLVHRHASPDSGQVSCFGTSPNSGQGGRGQAGGSLLSRPLPCWHGPGAGLKIEPSMFGAALSNSTTTRMAPGGWRTPRFQGHLIAPARRCYCQSTAARPVSGTGARASSAAPAATAVQRALSGRCTAAYRPLQSQRAAPGAQRKGSRFKRCPWHRVDLRHCASMRA